MIDTCITGASGFIGSHLLKRLSDSVIMDHGFISTNYDWYFDKVFFLSTYGNMAHHSDHRMMVQANVTDLLCALRNFNGWMCYMSSSSVTLPVQTPYSRSKRAAEEILQALPELKSCIVRCYSVTGVGEQKEHLIPTLIRSCMEGEEMPFDPYPVHDFVDVDDVVDGLVRLSEKQSTGIFEFGTGIATTNQKILNLVEKECGRKANVRMSYNLRKYDDAHWRCKTYSSRDSSVWNPIKFVNQSITEMVEAYRRERS